MSSLTFLFVLLAIASCAAGVDHAGSLLNGFVFNGVASGVFALLGIVVGMASENLEKRLGVAAAGVFGLFGVFLLRPQFNEAELLLSSSRLIVLSVFSVWVRHRRRLVFTNHLRSAGSEWGKLTLSHLFAFTAAIAAFLAFSRFLKDDHELRGAMFLVTMTIIVGVFAALVPFIAALAAIGAQNLWSGTLFSLAILMLAMCMGVFVYSQTDSLNTSLQFSLNSILEALTVTGALLVFRCRGYHLASLRTNSSEA